MDILIAIIIILVYEFIRYFITKDKSVIEIIADNCTECPFRKQFIGDNFKCSLVDKRISDRMKKAKDLKLDCPISTHESLIITIKKQ